MRRSHLHLHKRKFKFAIRKHAETGCLGKAQNLWRFLIDNMAKRLSVMFQVKMDYKDSPETTQS